MHQVGFYYIDVSSCFVRLKNCEKQYFWYLVIVCKGTELASDVIKGVSGVTN